MIGSLITNCESQLNLKDTDRIIWKIAKYLPKISAATFAGIQMRFGAKSRQLIKAPSVGKHEKITVCLPSLCELLQWKVECYRMRFNRDPKAI